MKYLLLLFFFAGCAGERPTNLGVSQEKLSPCPETPNCVSSFSSAEENKIKPLSGSIIEIKALLEKMDRVSIIIEEQDYLYAEFKSSILGFVDDVEFYFNPNENLIHVRSASRIGKSDFGVNRKRIEEIRSKIGKN